MTVKSADRVIQIFETVAAKNNGITHGELAKELGIPKGSLSFLLSNLVDRDYLTFDRSGKVYLLGPGLLLLTGRYLSNLDIVRIGRPVMHELVAEIDEDAEIAVMKGIDILFVDKEECSKKLKHSIAIGDRAPMYSTAAGKAILAYLSEDEITGYLSSVKMIPITKNTITDPRILRNELKDIRSKGIAYGRKEFYEDVIAIASPIFNLYGNVTGSIVVTIPGIRFNNEQKRFIEPRLKNAATKISYYLGFDANNIGFGSNNKNDGGGKRKTKSVTPS